VKVVCPKCGETGCLTRVKVNKNYYMRVEHWENGKRRVCYMGKDVTELRRWLEEEVGRGGAKILRLPGGDYHIANLLLPRLEQLCQKPRCTLVEVFGGSGYVSQTASRRVFGNIIYNDINDMLTTLYRYVKEHPEQLAFIISLLPYGRSYYRIIRDLVRSQELSSLAAAALVFYGYNTAFHGNVMRKGFSYAIDPNRNEAKAFTSRVAAILKFAAPWRDVVIENLDFRAVVKKYDSRRTVFYLDPPYPDRSEDYYGTPFTVNDLQDMAALLTQVKGRFLLKLDYRTYEVIKDVLPEGRYKVEVIERPIHMQKVRGGKKGRWLLTLVSNPPQS
jgi:DNA adenine methylase